MDMDTIKEAKELEKQITYCEEARHYAKNATAIFFKNKYNLRFTIGYLCRIKPFMSH